MEEEYILNSDLKKALGEGFYDYIIKELPTHSFESLDEAKIADIVFEHAPNGATNCMKTAQAICQHFKKAEGEK